MRIDASWLAFRNNIVNRSLTASEVELTRIFNIYGIRIGDHFMRIHPEQTYKDRLLLTDEHRKAICAHNLLSMQRINALVSPDSGYNVNCCSSGFSRPSDRDCQSTFDGGLVFTAGQINCLVEAISELGGRDCIYSLTRIRSYILSITRSIKKYFKA